MTKQTPSERLLKKSPDVMDVSRPLSRESAIILDEHHARIAANESQLARAMPFLETMAKRCLGGGNPLIDVEVRSTSLAFLNTKPTSPPAEAASEWPSDVIKVWQSIKSGDLFTLYDGGRLVLTVAETGRDMLSGVSARELDAMTSKYEVVFTRPPNPPAGQGDKGDGGPVCMGCLGTGFMEGVGPCKACRGSGNDKPSVAPPSPSASAKATVEEEARRWAEKCVGWDDQYVCLTLRRTPGDIGAMVLRGKLSPSYSGQFCEFLLAFHRQQSVGVVEEMERLKAEIAAMKNADMAAERTLRSLKDAAERERDDWKRDSNMFSRAWARELGPVRHKTHLIDTLVVGTQELKARSERAEGEAQRLRGERDDLAKGIEECHTALDNAEDHLPGTTSMVPLSTRLAKLIKEKARRVYYQDIVYAVCDTLDRINRSRGIMGELGGTVNSTVVCGTIEEPHDNVQKLMRIVERRFDASETAVARLTALVAAQKKVIEAWDVVGKDIFDTYAYDRLAAAKAELLRVGGGV